MQYINPKNESAWNNLGNIFSDQQQYVRSLNAYDTCISINPNHYMAINNRGKILMRNSCHEEALQAFTHSVNIKPDYIDAINNQAVAYRALNQYQNAIKCWWRVMELEPAYPYAIGSLIHSKLHTCDWENFDELLFNLKRLIDAGFDTSTPFAILPVIDDLSYQRVSTVCFNNKKFPKFRSRIDDGFDFNERIKIGYYSADFHDHATAHLMAQLFEAHDRQRFEIFAFSFGPHSDGPMRQRLTAAFDHFSDVTKLSDIEIANRSRELNIDIAVDLKGYTQDSRTGIFAHGCAPIQVNYLGYPGTMGCDYIDYIIADEVVIPPESRKYYSEKVVYLPGCYQVNDSTRIISDHSFTRAELGLPQEGFVFCCFNNNYKITPSTFDSWMRILLATPGSVLWLLADNPIAVRNLCKEAQVRGVNAKRIIFAPRMAPADHLARHRAADLFLDTLPCNAHTTASDALWAGLPLLTHAGESFAARVAASLLTTIEMPELITHNQADYERHAIEIALNPARLMALKTKLADKRTTTNLFNGVVYARHLEKAYSQMIDGYEEELARPLVGLENNS